MASTKGEENLLKYEKLYNWGKTLITSGVLKNGEKFPSENVLQRKFGYSRQTVRTALDVLEKEGLISRVKGSGTYVSYEGISTDTSKPHIGLVLSYFSDYLFPRIYDGIDSVMSAANYDIDVVVTKNRLNDEAVFLEGLLSRNISGIIIEGTRSSFPNPNIRLYEEIRKRNIPTLFIHNHYLNCEFDSVEMSDEKAAYQITEMLIKNGHSRIAGIFKYDDIQGIERYKGFIECLSDYGIKFDDDCIRWYSTKDMEEKLSPKGLLRMQRRIKECTAIFTYNDEVAGIYTSFLESKGMKVPEDISIVSFDDTMMQQDLDVKFTSVIHPKYNLGRIAGKKLLKMMNDPDWQQHNYSYCFPIDINDGNSIKNIR